jgi:hypothetical protein
MAMSANKKLNCLTFPPLLTKESEKLPIVDVDPKGTDEKNKTNGSTDADKKVER